MMIKLNFIKGFIEGNKFIMLILNGHKVYSVFNANMLRDMARQLDDTAVTIRDKKTRIILPTWLNKALSKELFDVADQLDNQ